MTISTSEFFQSLWRDYIAVAPQARAISELFASQGETVVNDHVAFRTLSESPIAQSHLETILEDMGYQAYGNFRFEQKKLNAKCYKSLSEPTAPKIFLSELQVHEMPEAVQEILRGIIDQIQPTLTLEPNLFWQGCFWQAIAIEDYRTLAAESEYGAWLATMGLRANHFTVSVNHLTKLESLEQVNSLLKAQGFLLNSTGNEIKGSPELKLEQSSTLADKMLYQFADGIEQEIPTCFYEFARRYPLDNGELFDSFIEGNADKIFSSTDIQSPK